MNWIKEISEKEGKLTLEIVKSKDPFLYHSFVNVTHLQEYLEMLVDVFGIMNGSNEACDEYDVDGNSLKNRSDQELYSMKKRLQKEALENLTCIERAIPEEFSKKQTFSEDGILIESIPEDSCLYSAINQLKKVLQIEEIFRVRNKRKEKKDE